MCLHVSFRLRPADLLLVCNQNFNKKLYFPSEAVVCVLFSSDLVSVQIESMSGNRTDENSLTSTSLNTEGEAELFWIISNKFYTNSNNK